MFGLFTSGSAFNRNSFRLLLGTGDNVIADAASGAGTGNATTSTTISADTWFHACGVYTSATSRAAFLNGGGKGTDATNRTPSGIDRTSVGMGDGSSASTPFAPAGTGYLAEVGIWDAALTDAEVAVLATGVSPLAVRPQSLVGYWPIVGKTSPEINYVNGTAVLSVQGTLSAAPHPRVFMPRTTRAVLIASAAVAGQPTWKRWGGISHMGGPRVSQGGAIW